MQNAVHSCSKKHPAAAVEGQATKQLCCRPEKEAIFCEQAAVEPAWCKGPMPQSELAAAKLLCLRWMSTFNTHPVPANAVACEWRMHANGGGFVHQPNNARHQPTRMSTPACMHRKVHKKEQRSRIQPPACDQKSIRKSPSPRPFNLYTAHGSLQSCLKTLMQQP